MFYSAREMGPWRKRLVSIGRIIEIEIRVVIGPYADHSIQSSPPSYVSIVSSWTIRPEAS
jgi:hypothetical protein